MMKPITIGKYLFLWVFGYVTIVCAQTAWNPQISGTAVDLNSVYFVDANTAWIVGMNGTILHTSTGGIVGVEELQQANSTLPQNYSLHQNFPNPFNPVTKIRFEIPAHGDLYQSVSLRIYNLAGQLVRTLIDDSLPAGVHELQWDSTDKGVSGVSSGIYFLHLNVGEFTQTQKMILGK